MTAPDTSVLIAGFDSAHPFHEAAQQALVEVRRDGRLIAHTLAETFAVLTAAGPYSYAPEPVLAYLGQFRDAEPVGLKPASYVQALAELAGVGIAGGAVYDALIAISAREAAAVLVSLDRRAAATYERCGVTFELLR